MTGHVQVHAFAIDRGKVEIGNDELLAIVDGLDEITRIRGDDCASSAFNPELLDVVGQPGWNVGCPHHQADRKHKASSFKRVVPACELRRFIHGGPYGDVNVLSGLMHSHPRERHPVLPADEASDTCLADFDRREASAISRSPHHALSEGWDELGMMIGDAAIWRKCQQGVVKSFLRRSFIDPFIDADDYSDAKLASQGRQLTDFRAVDCDAVFAQLRKNFFCRLMIPESGARANVEPNRVSGKPSLAEGYERSSLARCVSNDIERLGETCTLVVIDRRNLGNCDTDNSSCWILHSHSPGCSRHERQRLASLCTDSPFKCSRTARD